MRGNRFFTRKRVLTVIAAILLLATVFAIGGAFASLGDTTKVIIVKEGAVSCEVGQDYAIRNTGSVPVLMRAKIVVNWLDENGSVLALPPAGASVSVQTSKGWTHFPASAAAVDEGYWYCTGVVESNAKVSLISGIFSSGGSVRITVLAEAIQSTPKEAVSDAWGMTYSNGSWSVR